MVLLVFTDGKLKSFSNIIENLFHLIGCSDSTPKPPTSPDSGVLWEGPWETLISVENYSWFTKENSSYLGRFGGTEVKNRLSVICHLALPEQFLYRVSSLKALLSRAISHWRVQANSTLCLTYTLTCVPLCLQHLKSQKMIKVFNRGAQMGTRISLMIEKARIGLHRLHRHQVHITL